MYHFNHILYTVILFAVPFMTFIIWSIVGRPRIVKPKQWTIHPDADKLLELDEHESKIS